MWPLSFVGLAIALAYFFVVWLVSVKIRNYGLLDAAWSYGVAILAPLYAWHSPGHSVRTWLFTIVGVLWSLRLGTYILVRVLKHHPKEDVRYEKLRARWKGDGLFLVFFELQAVIAWLFSLPFLFVSYNATPGPNALEYAAIALAAICLVGEATSDLQMQAFKRDPANHGEVCQIGLWRYSRHPNYFFELSIWVAFFLFALSSPYGLYTIACPLMMAYFLFKVTGIPLTEEYALKSKGDKYRQYQRTVSAFVPWFRQQS